ncbi:MAG: hypothetical protein WEB02_07835 [Methylophaga sp.]
MTIIRTDEQADAQQILKSIIETADFYRAMGELLTEENLEHQLFEIAKERGAYIAPFQKVLKTLDELPMAPDPEKELVEALGGKVSQLFSTDFKSAILDRCLKKDDVLAELVSNTTLGAQSAEFKNLLDSLNEHLAHTKKRILNS